MSINTINADTFKKMFLAGAKNLEFNKEWINELNVFPVPDGDTGTNMTLTIMSAANEVNAIKKPAMDTLAKAISSGSLRGARGNSGVILSQLFRGFTKEISACEEINSEVFAKALQRAVETAYKAVMKPKEGTILTVAKGAANKALEIYETTPDLGVLLKEVLEHAKAVLDTTPDLLPVLKQAGVVDSGGQGLVVVLTGWYDALVGNPVIEFDAPVAAKSETSPKRSGVASTDDVDIKFGYCTEFIIMLEKEFPIEEEVKFKAYLESIGDSIVCVADDELVKIHVHTNDPGLAIQKALTYGSLTKMKIDNMREEHNERLFAANAANGTTGMAASGNVSENRVEDSNVPSDNTEENTASSEEKTFNEPPKKFGFIAVSAGSGLSEIFVGLGVDYVIEGGQTMNPSTEDFLNAISKINAENIFILPNNSNIILAASQAASLTEDKTVIVIPSKTVPQGITAMISFDETADNFTNESNMTEEMKRVKSGSVTYAVRDTVIDDKTISQVDIMGLGDKTILSVTKDIEETTLDLIDKLIDEESELVSVYYGDEITEDTANALLAKLEEKYGSIDIELHSGGQPIYYYLVSVE